jgi:hypothetical protein
MSVVAWMQEAENAQEAKSLPNYLVVTTKK